MKRLATFSLVLLSASGCASPRTYHVFLGGREQWHKETSDVPLDQTLSQELGTKIIAIQGDPSRISTTGTGGELGFTEQTGNWVSTLTGYYTSFKPISYTFEVQSNGKTVSDTLTPSEYGLDAATGYDIWIFRPQITYLAGVTNYSSAISGTGIPSTTTSSSESLFYLGGGLAIDVPIEPNFHVVGSVDYRVPLNSSGVSVNVVTAVAGIRAGGWTLK